MIDKKCSVDGCQKTVRSKSAAYCDMHYFRFRRGSALGASVALSGCAQCGAPLNGRRKFCSEACGDRHKRGILPTRICTVCGAQYQNSKGGPEVCSDDCRGIRQKQWATLSYQNMMSDETRKEALRMREMRRRARKSAGASMVERFGSLEIFERDGWMCGICNAPVNRAAAWPAPDFPTIDHIIPLSAGGAHTPSNVQCAHLLCNLRKGARYAA